MNDAPRQKLRELIARYGQALCNDRRRCEALLRDYCGNHRREVFVLISALREGITTDLLAPPLGMPMRILMPRLSQRLQKQLARAEVAPIWAVESFAVGVDASRVANLAKNAAVWAVESWAFALGTCSRTINDDEMIASLLVARLAHGDNSRLIDGGDKTTAGTDPPAFWHGWWHSPLDSDGKTTEGEPIHTTGASGQQVDNNGLFGEMTAGTLIHTICISCSHRFDVAEEGRIQCPKCHEVLEIDAGGGAFPPGLNEGNDRYFLQRIVGVTALVMGVASLPMVALIRELDRLDHLPPLFLFFLIAFLVLVFGVWWLVFDLLRRY